MDNWTDEKYQDYDANYPDWLLDKPIPAEPAAIDIFNDNRFEVVERGLVIDEPLSFEEYQCIWRTLEQFDYSLPWLIGDLLGYGELTYGEMYSQILGSETGEYNETCHFKPGTLRDYKYVANRFPVSSRLYALPWSYYQTVAGLEHSQAMALLQHCEEHGLKRAELRQQARELHNGKSNLLPATRDDINHELTVDNHRKNKRIEQLEAELAEMQQAVIMPDYTNLQRENEALKQRIIELEIPQKYDDPPILTTIVAQAQSSIEYFLNDHGYSSMTIYQNGDVKWIR